MTKLNKKKTDEVLQSLLDCKSKLEKVLDSKLTKEEKSVIRNAIIDVGLTTTFLRDLLYG